MFKLQLNAVLLGLFALCSIFACRKAPEITPIYTDNHPIISMAVNGVASNFKIGANLLKDSNTLSLNFEYLLSPGPNFSVAINRIPNQTGTYKIAKSNYPAFETNGSLFIANGDALYDIYLVLENASNSITISNLDPANKTISGDLKCTFVRENLGPKNHTFSDMIVVEKNGFVLPYTVN